MFTDGRDRHTDMCLLGIERSRKAILDSRLRGNNNRNYRLKPQDYGLQTLDSKLQTPDSGLKTSYTDLKTMDFDSELRGPETSCVGYAVNDERNLGGGLVMRPEHLSSRRGARFSQD